MDYDIIKDLKLVSVGIYPSPGDTGYTVIVEFLGPKGIEDHFVFSAQVRDKTKDTWFGPESDTPLLFEV
jgi:hypothetical protein